MKTLPNFWLTPIALAILAAPFIEACSTSEKCETTRSCADDEGETDDDEKGDGGSAAGGMGGMSSAVSCEEPLLACEGACIDPTSDDQFCGASESCSDAEAGEACGEEESCEAGVCTPVCTDAEILCDGACVDPLRDENFCGATGACLTREEAGDSCAAADGERCVQGSCFGWLSIQGELSSEAVGTVQAGLDDTGRRIAAWTSFAAPASVKASFFDPESAEWREAEVLGNALENTDLSLAVAPDGLAGLGWSYNTTNEFRGNLGYAISDGSLTFAKTLTPSRGRVSQVDVDVRNGAVGIGYFSHNLPANQVTLASIQFQREGGWDASPVETALPGFGSPTALEYELDDEANYFLLYRTVGEALHCRTDLPAVDCTDPLALDVWRSVGVRLSGDGSGVVFWGGQDASGSGLFVSRLAPNTAPTAAKRMYDIAESSLLGVNAQTGAAGESFFSVADSGAGIPDLRVAPLASSDEELSLTGIESLDTEVGESRVAMDEAGNIFVAWEQGTASGQRVYATRFDAIEKSWDEEPYEVAGKSEYDAELHDLQINEAGAAIVSGVLPGASGSRTLWYNVFEQHSP